MNYSIGIDIGGTKICFVLLKNSKVVKTEKIATPKNKKRLIETVEKNIKEMIFGLTRLEILGIGLGVTGPLNEKRDLILNPPNQKFLQGCSLAKIIEKDLKIKTLMDNDVRCFALAESLLGAGKKADFVLGITLGTGLGSGIVLGNKLFQGSSGAAGEVGHATIKFDGPKCSCSNLGCFEEYGSERFFKKRNYSAEELAKKAEKGDKKALKIFKEYGRCLGIGLGNAINVLDPEIIVLGGGIANAYRFFIKEAQKQTKKMVVSPLAKKQVKIKKAELGDFAGAIGAALLLCQKK